MAEEMEIGHVTHFFSKINVVAIELTGDLKVGDTIRIKGHTTDLTDAVGSMQLNHQSVPKAGADQNVGSIVKEHARDGDKVYRVS